MMRKKEHYSELSTNMMEEIRSQLPTDIIMEEILSRLPVKSLMRFRCVSKQWQNLFTDPRFIAKHMDRSTEKKPNPTRILQLVPLGPIYSSKIESYSTTTQMKEQGEGEGEGERQFQLHVKGAIFNELVEASCHGLVCLRSITRDDLGIDRFQLYNPTTRESLLLPQDEDFSNPFSVCGLGFIPITKEYKVVKITYHKGGISVMVYTVGDASHRWREIPHSFLFIVNYPWHNASICVGGSVHWLAKRSPTISNVIVSFDLQREVFQEMPSLPFYKPDMELCLGYLGGCLSVSTSFPMEDSIDLWVMKEYGVRDSWAKVFRMKSQVSEGINMAFVSSRGFSTDGPEILLMTDRTAPILYNPETQEMKTITRHCCQDFNLFLYASFVETLVSLKVESSETLPQEGRQEGDETN